MKLLQFSIIIIMCITYQGIGFAQHYSSSQENDFYIPDYETASRPEKLPPIQPQQVQQNVNLFDGQYDVKYVLVDGVFVPTFTKKEVQNINQPINTHPIIKQPINPQPEQITPKLETATASPTIVIESDNTKSAPIIDLPFDDTINEGIPPYRNIYAQYLKDTIAFQENKTFPYNANLKDALGKMNSNDDIVIFKGTIKTGKK